MKKTLLSVLSVLALTAVTAQAATPSLSYEISGNNLVITYTGTLLQSSDALDWIEVVSATSPYKVALSDKKLFFCVKCESEDADGQNFTILLADNVSLDMIWCPEGTFVMGSPSSELGRYSDEIQHDVTISSGFWIGKYEVTQAQYKTVMGNNPSWFRGNNLPVEQVNWYDTMKFCQKLTQIAKSMGCLPVGYEYTLPTEAQWEYACRAGTTAAFNNGTNIPTEEQIGCDYYDDYDNLHQGEPCSNLDSIAWYWYNAGTYRYTSHPVGQKKPNAWGLYDMHGNVWEWCLDWYGSYPSSAVTDPTGPDMGSICVLRGGSWCDNADLCRSADRYISHPANDASIYGFRVALAPVK